MIEKKPEEMEVEVVLGEKKLMEKKVVIKKEAKEMEVEVVFEEVVAFG